MRQVSAAMRSRRGASTRTVVRSSTACAALVPRDVMRWAFQDLRGTRAASWTGTRLLSRARSTRTSGTAASAAPVHGRLGCGPIGSTWSTKSAEYLTGSRCERAFCGRGDGRSHRACALCSTRAAAQEPVPRRPLPMAHHRHCWHRHSTAATGWVGTHTLAGDCRRTQDSAGTARAHLPADLPAAARPSSTLTRGTLHSATQPRSPRQSTA